eukprot:SAG31_NODE_155_length_22130_cov_9.540098_4_plen_225_part_00
MSGIGDALSKIHEGEQCAAAGARHRLALQIFVRGDPSSVAPTSVVCAMPGGTNFFGGHQTLLGRAIARLSMEVVLADSLAALDAARRGVPDAAFERLVEATILLSGLSFENCGLSVAHSLTRGFSAIPSIHESGTMHGEEVAFGLLVQLQLEPHANARRLQELLKFYMSVGLPCTLGALGVATNELVGAAETIATVTVADSPHLKNFNRQLDASDLRDAILVLG